MSSVLGASAFLPFIPLTPIQVLTNNLLYDFSQVPIPTDAVGAEQIAKPHPWNLRGITPGDVFPLTEFCRHPHPETRKGVDRHGARL